MSLFSLKLINVVLKRKAPRPFFKALGQKHLHRPIFSIALPMVFSNLTIPLLGLVDTAVMGHLEHSWYMGGVALGSTLIGVLYFLMGFLRMSTTGLSAQAQGAKNYSWQARLLLQGLLIAFGLSGLLLLVCHPFLTLVFSFSAASEDIKKTAYLYASLRIYGAPAALANLVILGWLLGKQKTRPAMGLLIFANLTNILLDFVLVVGGGFGVRGVAAATILADYSTLLLGLLIIRLGWRERGLPPFSKLTKNFFHDIKNLIVLNRDLFLRSLCLQTIFSFVTLQGANLGDHIVAANALLLGLLMLVSYIMDGFAYAIEALVGDALGAKICSAFMRCSQ